MTASEPTYTEDWFTSLVPQWQAMLAPLDAVPFPRLLEIGAFEGRATRWMLERFPAASVTVIDPFEDIFGQRKEAVAGIHARFVHNTAPFGSRCTHLRQPSWQALPGLMRRGVTFDFVYVDGSHEAADVMLDAVCGYQLLAPHGFMCFDDFLWNPGLSDVKTPKPAIISFLTTYADRIEVLAPLHRQAWIQKTSVRP